MQIFRKQYLLHAVLAINRSKPIKVKDSTQQSKEGRNGGTGIALLWLNLGARLEMGVQSHAPDYLPRKSALVFIVQEAAWAPGPV